MRHRGTAALLAGLSLGLAACAGDSGGAAAGAAAPLAVARAAQSSVVSAAGKVSRSAQPAARPSIGSAAGKAAGSAQRAARGAVGSAAGSAQRAARPAVGSAAGEVSRAKAPDKGSRATRSVRRRPAVPASSERYPRTPAGPPRPRSAPPARALAVADAARLAAPACEQYVAGLAGSMPRAVLARGSDRALAVLTESVAAALIGLPVVAPRASLPARERLDSARARISAALAAGENAKATAIARATVPRVRDYANALGITGCG